MYKACGKAVAALCQTLLPPIPTALLPRVNSCLLTLVPGRRNLQFL